MDLKKYFLFQILLQLLFILNKNFVKTEEYCPKICDCYSFNGLNRATCSGQKLINAFIEISEFVEIFDLNDNKISVLDNNCFKQHIHLKDLSIAHNKIHTIHFNAFLTLKKLRSIDLSYNQLQYINEKIFQYNYQLIEVNLSGNQFINLMNEPLFISTSVQGLFLKDCRIAYIYPKLFSQLLSLKYLDLSKNLMITLTTEPFKPLIKLQEVNLEENRWNCDHNIIDVMNTLKSKQVNIKINMCDLEFKKSNKVVKFEKIVVDPNLQIVDEEYNEEEKKPISTVWNKIPITENPIESCLINDIKFACNLYISCLKNLTITSEALYNSENDMKNLKKEKFFFHTIDHTELIFFFGVCIGAAIVFVMVACTLCVTKCCKQNQSENNKEENEVISANREFQFFHLERPESITATNERPPPVPVRRSSRRRRRRPPPPPLNRSISSPASETPLRTVNDFASFVTRLFERPARHRYYRAFNENTAHLIRRLSRSSLVNNRLSQHFLNETGRNRNDRNNVAYNSREANTRERLGSVENDDLIDELQLFIQEPDNNITPIHRTENSIEINTTGSDIQRSQTPPPAYNDVVRL